MGRRVSVAARAVALTLTLLWLTAFGSAAQAAGDARALVLVGGKAAPPPLSPTELRRLYLGKAVEKNGVRLVPLRNASDPLLYETFLQKFVFMSAPRYERYLLVQVYQSGGRRPPDYDQLPALVAALQREPGGVTFMWKTDAQALPEVSIIQELWREPVP
jgi:hypothetical protein